MRSISVLGKKQGVSEIRNCTCVPQTSSTRRKSARYFSAVKLSLNCSRKEGIIRSANCDDQKRFVIPTGAKRSGGTCCSLTPPYFLRLLHLQTPKAPYPSTKNFPSRIICSSSTQILNFRPTTSICVVESHSAPVCAPYGFPNAICTPGYFSSCRICPITSFKSMFVPMANSPTRSLFSSVCVYFQKSFSSS